MPKHALIKRSAIAAALAFSLYAPTSYANYSQLVIFGDSLSDTGNLASQINTNPILSSFTGTPGSSFTTNPDTTWAGTLAKSYGLTADPNDNKTLAGTNYAVGGAKADKDETTAFNMIAIPSVRQQMDNYFANNQKADPSALYAVWIGANDLLAASSKPTTEALAEIQATSLSQANSINRLHEAGATQILVPNLPDVGITPRAVGDPSIAQPATLAATVYNSTLFSQLNTLEANVIPANTFALLQEAVTNKEKFGFTNVSGVACQNLNNLISSLGCLEGNWQITEPTANETYAFADDIHPSGRTHRILAQYYQNIIDAPAQIAPLPAQLIRTGSAKDRQLNRRMDTLDSHTHSLWADVSGSQDADPIVTLGFDNAGQHRNTGFYLSHQEQDDHLGSTMSVTTKAVGAGLYHRQKFGNVQLKANAGIDRLSIDTNRHIVWDGAPRAHTSETNGRRTHAGLQLGYQLGNSVTYRPYIGVNAQKLRVGDIIENNPNLSTAMHFNKQTQKSLQGELGLDLQYSLNDKADLYGGVSVSREFNDDERIVTASLPSIREYTRGFNTIIKGEKDTYAHAHLGAKYKFGNANLNASIAADRIDGDTDVGGLIGMQMKF